MTIQRRDGWMNYDLLVEEEVSEWICSQQMTLQIYWRDIPPTLHNTNNYDLDKGVIL